MDETTPDASPLTPRFLASLASFMKNEHELMGEGDISSKVKVAIAESKADQDIAPEQSENPPSTRRNSDSAS